METASPFLCFQPNTFHFRSFPSTITAISPWHYNKHLQFSPSYKPPPTHATRLRSEWSFGSVSLMHSPTTTPIARKCRHRCSLSNTMKESGVGILSIAIAATKWTVNLVYNPFFWMYFSWSWLFWPWMLALVIGIYGLYCLRKHLSEEANVFEQLAIVTSAFTWFTLAPPAHFNGFLQVWPYVFFLVYHYFFFNVSIRKRLYGDYYAREHDPKWDISPPIWCRGLFCIGVTAGHWLAAFEGPELHLIPGGWSKFWIWILIMLTLFMQYNSTFYLSNYSEKVVAPTAVVQFGPYRWVRHPVYSSTMLLFMTYCGALRAPLSMLFLVVVCLMYYEQKARLEECLMLESFGDRYREYMTKVKHKFIPFVY